MEADYSITIYEKNLKLEAELTLSPLLKRRGGLLRLAHLVFSKMTGA